MPKSLVDVANDLDAELEAAYGYHWSAVSIRRRQKACELDYYDYIDKQRHWVRPLTTNWAVQAQSAAGVLLGALAGLMEQPEPDFGPAVIPEEEAIGAQGNEPIRVLS